MKRFYKGKSNAKNKRLKLWSCRKVAMAFLTFIFSILIFTVPSYACLTPVFLYALERWPADYYEGVLIHNGPLADNDPAVLLLQSEQAEFLNLIITLVDLESSEASELPALLYGPVPESLPALALWYPSCKGRTAPFWTGQFTPETIEALIQSPKRQELAKRLTAGQTAVWIFVESGNAGKDKAAMQLIKEELDTATKDLKQMATAPGFAAGAAGLCMPGLSYEFSILPVSRSDPKEQMLIEMLLKSEPDLHEYADEPIVFPTFGRGRALFALVGEGINVDNLREAIAFITGACGCEIKMLNPGVDLLMAEDWDAAVMKFYQEFYEASEEQLPELTSVFPGQPADAGLNAHGETVTAAINPDSESRFTGNGMPEPAQKPERISHGFGVVGTTAVSLAAILVAVVLGTFAVTKRKKSD